MNVYIMGLFLDFLGAVAIGTAASVQTTLIYNHIKVNMNLPGWTGLVDNAQEKNIQMVKTMTFTDWCSKIGYVLFGAGFALQIYYYLYLIPK